LRQALWVLLVAVVVCVVDCLCQCPPICCLARSETRQKEIAIRAALGAGPRPHHPGSYCWESYCWLSRRRGGLLLAALGLRLLPLFGTDRIPRGQEIGLNLAVLGFTLGLSLLTGVIFGLAPALQALKFDLHTTLKEGGRTAVCAQRPQPLARGAGRGRSGALTVAAGRSRTAHQKLFGGCQQVDTGFRSEQLLTMRLFRQLRPIPTINESPPSYEALLERVQSLPGVKEVAVAEAIPIGGGTGVTGLQVEGKTFEMKEQNLASWRIVSPGYFFYAGTSPLARSLARGIRP